MEQNSSRQMYSPKNLTEVELELAPQIIKPLPATNLTSANYNQSDISDADRTLIEKTVVYDPLGEAEFDDGEENEAARDSSVDKKIPFEEPLVQFDNEQQESPNGRVPESKLEAEFEDLDALNLTSFYGSSERVKDAADEPIRGGAMRLKLRGNHYSGRTNTTSLLTGEPTKRLHQPKAHTGAIIETYRAQASHLMESSGERSAFQVANMCAMQLSSSPGICITYGAVEFAIRAARRVVRFSGLPEDLNSAEPSERTINTIGELNEWTTRILASQFGLGADEVALDMGNQIDIRQTSLWRTCPRIFRSMPILSCPVSRYRTYNGECNNLASPHLGATYMPFVRQLLPQYRDSVGEPRGSQWARADTGAPLPSARLVALHLHPDLDSVSSDQSVLFSAWGQLVNHDLALAAGARRKYPITQFRSPSFSGDTHTRTHTQVIQLSPPPPHR